MKKRLFALFAIGYFPSVFALPTALPMGDALSYGNIAVPQSQTTPMHNPAAPSVSRKRRDTHFRIGLLNSIGFGYETGELGKTYDTFEPIVDKLENKDNLSLDEINDVVDDANAIIKAIGDNVYFKTNLALQLPLMPIDFGGNTIGSFTIDGGAVVQSKISILDAPFRRTGTSADPKLETKTAAYAKAAYVASAGLGYSRRIMETPLGTVHAGVRLKLYDVGLGKHVAPIETAGDVDTDTLDYVQSETNSADIGVLIDHPRYTLGATVTNINSPHFYYNELAQDCATEGEDCYLVQSFSDEIDLKEVHIMDPQLRLEAIRYGLNEKFIFGASLDTNAVPDAVGDPIQWATVTLSYAPDSWIIPGLRTGYRRNLAGTKLNYFTMGLTLFKNIHVDAAYSIEHTSVKDSNDEDVQFPRSFFVNIGISLNF